MYFSLAVGCYIIGFLLNWLLVVPYMGTVAHNTAELFGILHTSQEAFIGAYIIVKLFIALRTKADDAEKSLKDTKETDGKRLAKIFGSWIILPLFKMGFLWAFMHFVIWYHGHLFN